MTAWLWPDRVIYKRESRRLREEHNAVVNSHDDLLTASKQARMELGQMHTEYCPECKGGCPTRAIMAELDTAIATGRAVA